MQRRDAGFMLLGAGIVVILCCVLLLCGKSGNVMILETYECTAIKAHREQTNSMIIVIGEKEWSHKNWNVRRSNDHLIIKDVSTPQLNDQARIDINNIIDDKLTEKRKTSYATIKLHDLVFLNLEHPRNHDLFHLLNFEDGGKYWRHPLKKEIDKVQWEHYVKNNYEAPRERYFTIDIPEMEMTFVAYESGTRIQMVAVNDYSGIMKKGEEDTSKNLLPKLREKALIQKARQQ